VASIHLHRKTVFFITYITAEPVLCGFDETSTSEMMTSSAEHSRTIAEERSAGFRRREL
jgi:hypothetical protein